MPVVLDLPTELLLAIVDYIDSTSDLLSLALACRHIYTLCIPEPLCYRILTEPPTTGHSREAWKTTSDNPHLSRMVRIIDVRITSTTEVARNTRIFFRRVANNLMRLLPVIVSNATNLVELCLDIALETWLFRAELELLRQSVTSACTNLRAVRVRKSPAALTNSFWQLARLTTLKIHIDILGGYTNPFSPPIPSKLAFLLSRNPHLKILHITFVEPSRSHIDGYQPIPVDETFANANLRRLQDLRLGGVSWQSSNASVFLHQVHSLCALHLNIDGGVYPHFLAECALLPGSVPLLRTLSIPRGGDGFLLQIARAGASIEELTLCGCPGDSQISLITNAWADSLRSVHFGLGADSHDPRIQEIERRFPTRCWCGASPYPCV